MTYFILDTETNGLPQSYHLPIDDLPNWPRLISIAWALYDEAGHQIQRESALVKPNGYRWNRVAQRIHGITPERAGRDGSPLAEVIDRLVPDILRADAWVGHNLDLDYGVVGAEYVRSGAYGTLVENSFRSPTLLCTMEASRKVTADGADLRLDDLYKLLFGKPMKGMHDATADMLATADCFFEMRRRGLL